MRKWHAAVYVGTGQVFLTVLVPSVPRRTEISFTHWMTATLPTCHKFCQDVVRDPSRFFYNCWRSGVSHIRFVLSGVVGRRTSLQKVSGWQGSAALVFERHGQVWLPLQVRRTGRIFCWSRRCSKRVCLWGWRRWKVIFELLVNLFKKTEICCFLLLPLNFYH